ncbi:transposase-like protein [Bradyrhizobium sp. LB14.3]
MTSKTTIKFSPEVRTRAVRMVLDHAGEHPSRWAAVRTIAAKIGCTPQTVPPKQLKRSPPPRLSLNASLTPWRRSLLCLRAASGLAQLGATPTASGLAKKCRRTICAPATAPSRLRETRTTRRAAMTDRDVVKALNALAETPNQAAVKLDAISRSVVASGLLPHVAPGSPVARMVEQGERYAAMLPQPAERTKWTPPKV